MSSLLERYRVRGHIHLGFVLGDLDVSPFTAEHVSKLTATGFTRPVEPVIDSRLAPGARDLHGDRLYLATIR